MNKKLSAILSIFLLLPLIAASLFSPVSAQTPTYLSYLPAIQKPELPPEPLPTSPIVNVPFFSGDVIFNQSAVFWFGRVKSDENYIDVRLGYNSQSLVVHLTIFDRRLWYDTSPQPSEFSDWDSASLFLSLDGQEGSAPGPTSYRFDAQLSWYENRDNYQISYRGNGSGWSVNAVPFTSTAGYRGSHNDGLDDKGWAMAYTIPFSSLGISQPADGAIWGIGLNLFDRDDSGGSSIPVQIWPENLNNLAPSTWAGLRFGTPIYTAPPASNPQSVTVRHLLNSATVVDGEVGGGAICGDGLDYWTQWGDYVNPGGTNNSDFNIQNQSDVADWPCFSKFYVTFPLTQVPAGKVILSATLILHQMGGSGGGSWGDPASSLIQVYTVKASWLESTLSWNNGPQAWENVSAAWVPWTLFPGWPGIPREWDLSRAVSQAYAGGTDLKLVLYSADDQYHSGKYFVSSDTQDWNQEARPTLIILYGTP